MEQNPDSTVNEYLLIFSATRRELIALNRFLACEGSVAFDANNATLVAVVEALTNRTQSLLERIEECEMEMAIRAAEFSGVN